MDIKNPGADTDLLNRSMEISLVKSRGSQEFTEVYKVTGRRGIAVPALEAVRSWQQGMVRH